MCEDAAGGLATGRRSPYRPALGALQQTTIGNGYLPAPQLWEAIDQTTTRQAPVQTLAAASGRHVERGLAAGAIRGTPRPRPGHPARRLRWSPATASGHPARHPSPSRREVRVKGREIRRVPSGRAHPCDEQGRHIPRFDPNTSPTTRRGAAGRRRPPAGRAQVGARGRPATRSTRTPPGHSRLAGLRLRGRRAGPAGRPGRFPPGSGAVVPARPGAVAGLGRRHGLSRHRVRRAAARPAAAAVTGTAAHAGTGRGGTSRGVRPARPDGHDAARPRSTRGHRQARRPAAPSRARTAAAGRRRGLRSDPAGAPGAATARDGPRRCPDKGG
jgi:hypothetical protein